MNNIKIYTLNDYYLSNLYNNDDELDELEDQKDEYYMGDFWYDSDIILSNKFDYQINFVKIDDEIFLNTFDDINDFEYITELLEYFSETSKEYFKETDYIKFEGNWSWFDIAKNTDKPDFVIKYRGWVWYTYRFYEYNLI